MLLRYRSDVLALRPKVVVLLAGTNDLVAFKLPDTVGFVEQSISSIVELAQAHGERVILCSVLPVSDAIRPQTRDRHPEDIVRLNTWLKSYAAEKHIAFVDYYSALTDGHDRIRTELTIDGLHPNRAGYEKMEPLVEHAIERELAGK
jgi:lysophospholipase L1-like esterase